MSAWLIPNNSFSSKDEEIEKMKALCEKNQQLLQENDLFKQVSVEIDQSAVFSLCLEYVIRHLGRSISNNVCTML